MSKPLRKTEVNSIMNLIRHLNFWHLTDSDICDIFIRDMICCGVDTIQEVFSYIMNMGQLKDIRAALNHPVLHEPLKSHGCCVFI